MSLFALELGEASNIDLLLPFQLLIIQMSTKIAAESFPNPPPGEKPVLVVVRVYDGERDKAAVEELERQYEVGKPGKPSVVTDLMGDPTARIRNFTSHIMLVAEYGFERRIVGVIRGCLKSVTKGTKPSGRFPAYVKLACILGLRVSTAHRRLGIGTKLVQQLEEWCGKNGADYAYMATECSNQPSLNLFTIKFNYIKFRSPTVLVQPIHAHDKPLSSSIALIRVSPELATLVYRRVFASSEFFPEDVDMILNNKLSLGTFVALPKGYCSNWDPKSDTFPPSFAILSIWNTKEVFKLKVKGVSSLKYACSVASRAVDAFLPWLRLPSIPNIFRQFGLYFLYGLHMEGPHGSYLMRSLCSFAHNMAKDDRGCGILAAEVNQNDPVKEAIPHWKRFSWDDLWCIKKLAVAKEEGQESGSFEPQDWIKSRASSSSVTFVDPRDI